MLDFDTACERLLKIEGGYVNHPSDPGGETNLGITWPVLREAIAAGIVPASTTIAGLTRDQAKAIYKWKFWDVLGDLHPAVKWQAFDFAVNSGLSVSILKLQAALGVAQDGHWGPVTAAKANAMDVSDIIMRFAAQRLMHMTALSIWPTFGKGWARRIANDLMYGAEDN